jgi:hypothetical protein
MSAFLELQQAVSAAAGQGLHGGECTSAKSGTGYFDAVEPDHPGARSPQRRAEGSNVKEQFHRRKPAAAA